MSLTFVGCLPQDPPEAVRELQERNAGLEARITELEEEREAGRTLVSSQVGDLEQRIAEAERSRRDYRETVIREANRNTDRIQRVERTVRLLNEAILSGQRATGFSITRQGHFPVQTRYGSFLMELTGYDKTGEGYDLHLRVANATSFKIFQFRLRGEFGRRSPDLPEDASFAENAATLDEWESSLTRFDREFDTRLEPGTWNSIVLPLPAPRLIDLEFIRLWFEVQRVSLQKPPSAKPAVVFDATQSELSVLSSDYGTFYLKMEDIEPAEGGQELTLRFGNPLGITINEIRLTGSLGRNPPRTDPDVPPDQQQARYLRWRQSLRPFDVKVSRTLKPMQWTTITFELPARSKAELQHVECRLDLLQVHLRAD